MSELESLKRVLEEFCAVQVQNLQTISELCAKVESLYDLNGSREQRLDHILKNIGEQMDESKSQLTDLERRIVDLEKRIHEIENPSLQNPFSDLF
jgi:archaellum component FlaC